MKNKENNWKVTFFSAIAIVALAFAGLGFIAINITSLTGMQAGNVEVKDNINIFSYCKPVANYDVLGMVRLPGMVGSERADRVLETLIKRAKKDFPSVQALIVNEEFSKAECIKFKQ